MATKDQPKPRKYGAKVKLTIAGAARPRYFTSQRAALVMYRDLSMRLVQNGRPMRPAQIEPVRGWEGLIDTADLAVSSAGGVVVKRAARRDDFRSVAAPIWPANPEA